MASGKQDQRFQELLAELEALKESEKKWRMIAEGAPDVMYSVDREGRILFINKTVPGLNREDVTGRRVYEFLPPEQHEFMQKTLEQVYDTGKPCSYESPGAGAYYEPAWYICNLSPVLEQGKVISVVAQTLEITDRKKAEEALANERDLVEKRVQERTLELTKANEKLRESDEQLREAVRVRDEFIAIASHELRTPLTPMKLQLQLIDRILPRGKQPTDEDLSKVRSMLAVSGRQLDRLARLVTDMLDVSRIAAGKLKLNLEAVSLGELTHEVVERFQADAKAVQSPLTMATAPELVGQWDRLRLEQVLVNFLSNAMKYGAGQPIHIEVYRDGGRACLSVADRGIGIGKEDQKRIFERFERAASAHQFGGLGLGLYIANQIASAHGGVIDVKSDLGKGAVFTLSLPL